MAIGEEFGPIRTREVEVLVRITYDVAESAHMEFTIDKMGEGLYDVPGIENVYWTYDAIPQEP